MKSFSLPLVIVVLLGVSGSAFSQTQTIILNTADAPAELLDAQLIRNSLGVPEVVRVTVRNTGPEPLAVVSVDALVFNEKGALRLQAFSGGPMLAQGQRPTLPGGAIPSQGVRVTDIAVHHVEGRPDWTVVVALKEADTTRQVWTADNERLKLQAAELVSRR